MMLWMLLATLATAVEPVTTLESGSIEWAYRPAPAYPVGVAALGLTEQVCEVNLRVAESGMVQTLHTTGCHVAYGLAVQKLRHWRAQPSTPTPFETRVKVRFVPREAPVERLVDANSVNWKDKAWPKANGAPTTCEAHMLVGADGAVDAIYVEGCPSPWDELAAHKMSSWTLKTPTGSAFRVVQPITFVRL